MKNVKLRVPAGKVKEAHDYMVSLSPENKGVLWDTTIAKSAHFYLDEMGVIGWTGEHGEEFFLSSPKREIFLPCHDPKPEKVNRYRRLIKTIVVPASDTPTTIEVTADFYDIATAWEVHCPAHAHALKKLLQPGDRGAKGFLQDLREVIQSVERAIELEESRDDNSR